MIWDKMSCINGWMVKSNLVISLVPYWISHFFQLEYYRLIPITIIYAVMFVTGVIGNILVCFVIVHNKSMHSATNYYLFSLAIADLIILLLGKSFNLEIVLTSLRKKCTIYVEFVPPICWQLRTKFWKLKNHIPMSKSKPCFEILGKKAFRWYLETWKNQIGSIFKLNIKKSVKFPS